LYIQLARKVGFTLGALLSLPIIQFSTDFFASEWGMQEELSSLGFTGTVTHPPSQA